MNKTLSIAFMALLACHAARADEKDEAAARKAHARAKAIAERAAAGGAKGAAPKVETGKTEKPANISEFTSRPDDHNPFWPIGWNKSMAMPTSDAVVQVVPRVSDFNVTTIVLNEPPMAVINGKEMAEGEIAMLPINGTPVAVQLMAVQDGRVIIRWQNQSLLVPIHRNEMLAPSDSGTGGPQASAGSLGGIGN